MDDNKKKKNNLLLRVVFAIIGVFFGMLFTGAFVDFETILGATIAFIVILICTILYVKKKK